MGVFLSYSVIGGLIMLPLFLAYRLFLAKDNQHSFNRAILVSIYIVSLLIPPVLMSLEPLMASAAPAALTLENAQAVTTAVITHTAPLWGTVAIWIFIAGMIVVTVRSVHTWIRLTHVVRLGRAIERDGYTIIVSDDERFAPFSWMHYIVVSINDIDSDCSAITTHELKHIRSHHWIDLLVAQIVCIVNWFNPVAWLMRDEIMLIHEYQADMAVLEQGHNPQEYQMLLIKKAVGARFPSLANSLNHSKLKKRITMMYKTKSSVGRRFKALALVPMLPLALGVASVPAVRAAVATISSSEVTVGKVNKIRLKAKSTSSDFKVASISNNNNRTTVILRSENPGNDLTVSEATFTTDGTTYGASSLNCSMADGLATITATFPFISIFDNTSMTLTVNGEHISLDLEDFFYGSTDAQSELVNDTTASAVIVNSISTPTLPENMKIYLDGVEITHSQLKELSPESIISITVNRQTNSIEITSRH